MTQANDERAARKEYIRRRQKTVFSIVGAVMVVAMVVSLLFFFHVGGLGNVKSAAVQPNYGQQAPCPIKEADGNKAKYVENRNITLRVLNGTKFSGFAKAVSDALQNREFNPQTPGNYTKKVDRTMIVFGKNGVNQAYTVASNFTDAMLVMDDRQDQLIDVIVGATFDNLQDTKKVPAAGKAITGIDRAEQLEGVTVYHAGTAVKDGKLVTNGGRVLGVTATAPTLDEAIQKAYADVKKIHFDKAHYRTDIGVK